MRIIPRKDVIKNIAFYSLFFFTNNLKLAFMVGWSLKQCSKWHLEGEKPKRIKIAKDIYKNEVQYGAYWGRLGLVYIKGVRVGGDS